MLQLRLLPPERVDNGPIIDCLSTRCSLIKADVHSHHRSVVKARAQEVYAKLSQPLQRAMDLNSEKGSSSWLTVLPFRDQGSI